MENLIIEVERKILDTRIKQINSITVVNTIDKLAKEREYLGLLQKHSKRIGELDSKLESLYIKRQDYKNLMNEPEL